jgi:hypothetical protein
MNRIEVLKVMIAILLSIGLTAAYGLLSGFPANPEVARQRIHQLEKIDRDHPVMTPEDRERLWDIGRNEFDFATGERTILTDVRSSLVWNAHLFFVLFIALLFLFRPSYKATMVVSMLVFCVLL